MPGRCDVATQYDDLHSEIKDDLVAIAVQLWEDGQLPILPTAQSIVNQTIKDQTNVDFPVLWFSIEGEREEASGGTTQTQRWVYPVRVALCAKDVVMPQDEKLYTAARKVLMRAYHRRPRSPWSPITGYGSVLIRDLGVCGTEVVPNVVFDPQFLQFRTIVTGFLVKVEAYLPNLQGA